MSSTNAPLVYVTQSGHIIPSGYTSKNLPQGEKEDTGDIGPQGDTQGSQGDTGAKAFTH